MHIPREQNERLTLALHALAEQALEQAFAVLADGGACVCVDDKSMWHFHPPQHHLLHPDRPTTPGWDSLPCFLMGALLLDIPLGKEENKKEFLQSKT